MPVENPPIEYPNQAYINSLNPDWPTGADFPSDGDDHIRGIKNVLKQTFPNLTGPVTLTQAEINSGSKLLAAGTVCLFYQQNAPTGWTRVNPTVGSRMLVLSTGTTGIEGGADDPLFNNKVPAHNHAVVGTTEAQNANHTHAFTVGGGGHEHVYARGSFQVGPLYGTPNQALAYGEYATSTEGGGEHVHSGTTAGVSNNHGHSVSITSQNNANSGNWAPRYSVVLMARRD